MLTFTPTAWAKLLYLRDLGPTEVGGFGVSELDDLLCVRDIVLLRQQCTETFVAFDDLSVAEFFDNQIDAGRQPQQFGRIWIHTHPGQCAQPSSVDIETFQRAFGTCDWAVMFILARGGETYARLHWRQGGASHIPLRVEVKFNMPFTGSDHETWQQEFDENVQPHCDHRFSDHRWPEQKLDERYFDTLFELP